MTSVVGSAELSRSPVFSHGAVSCRGWGSLPFDRSSADITDTPEPNEPPSIKFSGNTQLTARIGETFPEVRVLVLTTYDTDTDILRAIEAGAAGYLLKDTDPGRLPFALRGVLEGEAALPRGLVARLIDEFRTRGKRRRLPLMRQRGVELTEREWEVLEYLHDGLTTAEIAERLSISPVTVRRHVSEILKKLRVTSREEAVRLLEGGDGGKA